MLKCNKEGTSVHVDLTPDAVYRSTSTVCERNFDTLKGALSRNTGAGLVVYAWLSVVPFCNFKMLTGHNFLTVICIAIAYIWLTWPAEDDRRLNFRSGVTKENPPQALKPQQSTDDYMDVLGNNEVLDPWALEGKGASWEADLYPWKLKFDQNQIHQVARALESHCPSGPGPNHYETLGVSPKATILELQDAYNQAEQTQHNYQEIQSLYTILSVPPFRCLYDHKCGITQGRWHGLSKAVSVEC